MALLWRAGGKFRSWLGRAREGATNFPTFPFSLSLPLLCRRWQLAGEEIATDLLEGGQRMDLGWSQGILFGGESLASSAASPMENKARIIAVC